MTSREAEGCAGSLLEEVFGEINPIERRLWLSGILTLPSVEVKEEPDDDGERFVKDGRCFLGLFFRSVGKSKELV
jgi:hypothetical protein